MPSVSLFGTDRTVPAQGETDWGENVSGILTDLIKAMDKMAYLVGDIPYLLMSKDEQIKAEGETIDIEVGVDPAADKGANRIVVTAASAITLGATDANVIDDGHVDGQTLLIQGTSNTNTIRLASNHQNVDLNGDVVLGKDQAIFLLWSVDVWIELSRSN